MISLKEAERLIRVKMGRKDVHIEFIKYIQEEDCSIARLVYPNGGFDYVEIYDKFLRVVDPTTGKIILTSRF